MTIGGGLAVYFVIWWLMLFVTLPFGVRSQLESGKVEAGTEPGAPTMPLLLRKVVWTTVLAAVVFAGIWYLWTFYDF